MSWGIYIAGKASDVKAAVAAIETFPQPLKDAVALFADAGDANRGIRVRSNGHYSPNDSWSSVGEFSVMNITIAEPAKVADAPEAAQATTA